MTGYRKPDKPKRRRMQRNEIRRREKVTDHAVLRYLERVKGVDVSAARTEIGCICMEAMRSDMAVDLVQGDVTFVIREGTVITVQERKRLGGTPTKR